MAIASECWQLPRPTPGVGPYDLLSTRLVTKFDFCTQDFLNDQLHRAQRGLLCYWLCSQQELKCFVGSRRVELRHSHIHLGKISGSPLEPDMSMKELAYIKLLELADDQRTFQPFTALPRDVRLIVYEFAMLPFPAHKDKDAIPQPPITKVSRLLRSESLPLFYQTQRIKIRITPNKGRFHMSIKMMQYLLTQTDENLTRIRRLSYYSELPNGHHSDGASDSRCVGCSHELYVEVNLDQRKAEKQLVMMIRERSTDSQKAYHCLRLSSAVGQFLRAVNTCENGRLRHEDFATLMKIVGEATFCGDRNSSFLRCRWEV